MGSPAVALRNRIVGQGSEAPEQLLANPGNWRTHPPRQREALRGSLETVGWVQQVLVNRTTGHVVDGHARVEEAITRGEAEVPVLYVAAPSGDMEVHFRLALDDAGLPLRESIVWVKDRFVMGRQDYHWRHESVLYGWREGAAHYFVDDRTQDTVWEIARPGRSEAHPTMKPVELVSRAIANSSRPGDAVYDPFDGSGTTIVAAEQLGRRAYGMEIDPRYVAVAIERWEKFTGKTSERLDG